MGLKSFARLTSKNASVDYSLKIVFMVSAASVLVSCLADNCSDRANETTSFLSNDGLTFPVILQRASPNPVSPKPNPDCYQEEWVSKQTIVSVETGDTSV